MQADFWTAFAEHAQTLEAVILDGDAAAFSELTNELADCLLRIEPRLNINIGGPDPFCLAVLPLPGAEQLAETFVKNGSVPERWNVSVGVPEFDPIESVNVQDESGDSLSVPYADLDAKILPPVNGTVTIIFSLDANFDPNGPRAHMYQAVAENCVFTVLGGWPQQLAKAILLPRSQTGKLVPLTQLRQQWIDIVCDTPSP